MVDRSRLLRVATAVGIATLTALGGGPAAAAPGAAACESCGGNLIRNAGAEAGQGAVDDVTVPVPRWHTKNGLTAASYRWSGGDLSSSTAGPANPGENYFYGGPANSVSTATQQFAVDSSGIENGDVTYKLSGWLGGYDGQEDHAILVARFLAADGTILAHARIGPVSKADRNGHSGLQRRGTSGPVPPRTASIAVQLTMVRDAGSDNDGLADDLSLKLIEPQG